MGLFKKKDKFVDLSERLRNQQEKINQMKQDFSSDSNNSMTSDTKNSTTETSAAPFPFFAGNQTNETNSTSEISSSEGTSSGLSPEERRKRLGKRLLDMTNKLEEISNQIYRLEQRIETLERKSHSPF